MQCFIIREWAENLPEIEKMVVAYKVISIKKAGL